MRDLLVSRSGISISIPAAAAPIAVIISGSAKNIWFLPIRVEMAGSPQAFAPERSLQTRRKFYSRLFAQHEMGGKFPRFLVCFAVNRRVTAPLRSKAMIGH